MTVIIVNGWFDNCGAETIYAGHDLQGAKAVARNSPRDEFELQVWVSGIQVETYESYDGVRWELTFDKQAKVKEEVDHLRDKLEEAEKELEVFKDAVLFGGNI
ncbi:hypothetical protein Thu_230 [Bacillus phage Thurquoise]|uniref:Uncharacterized protein n=1 Tax=Bacillus phage Deep Blue TaxID=1792245 RepID=A0A140HLL3_9CAUD|nr:hypothetical protein Blue_052 [Bacillus phage Deep Blue]AMO25875.1 hypothetical protein Blue_052 [Bacillus phage Deep Blue]UXQ89073.1 hypothetical protein Thu_230 [Bacillus phage Thurquoise]